jgi:hypothetical protein
MTDDGVLLFIDAIEDDTVRVLLGEALHSMPRALLPASAQEGSWLRLRVDRTVSPDEESEARRARLLRSDPGGPVKL